MQPSAKQNERIAKMTFASVYPHYLSKVEKKDQSEEDLIKVIEWLTGYTKKQIESHKAAKTTFEEFFGQAEMNSKADLIKGVICGYRVEDIENQLTRQVRYLDKLVDELAKGKKMQSILRQ